MTLDRTLPHNLEAEKSLLGAILIDNAQFAIASMLVDVADFYRAAHRQIWLCMGELAKDSKAIDLVTLKDELQRRAQLDEVGGPAYMASLTDGVPRASNIDYYAGIIREKSALRSVIETAKRAMDTAFDQDENAVDVLGQAIKSLVALEGRSAIRQFPAHLKHISEVMGEIDEEWKAGPPDFLATPWPELNHRLEGGMIPGEYLAIGGRPGDGKTALAGHIGTKIARDGRSVIMLSREMKRTRIGGRLIAGEGGVHVGKIRRRQFSLDDEKRARQAMVRLSTLPMFISHAPASAESIREMAYICREEGTPIGLLIVDYLQLLDAPKTIRERRQQVEHVSAGLKAVTTDFTIPIIALSSVSRPQDERALPTMRCFRESGNIEHDVDTALILHSPDGADSDVRNLVIAKARDGSPGVMQLLFRRAHQRFAELDSHHSE